MQKLSRALYKNDQEYPEKVLQFGEGNFLRAFVDWQIHVLNQKADFNGSVVVVQPRGFDKINRLNGQDGLYTLYLQGIKDGQPVNEHMVIDSISRGINLFKDYNQYIHLAESQDLRYIISNTTEAGIGFDPTDKLEDVPPKSFPGKLTAFLYHRFKAFAGNKEKGCIIIPCELIENNGQVLKEVVLQLAALWKLEKEFIDWLNEANTFCSSLVDRIVPGFPKDSIDQLTQELGYQDELIVVGEQYHSWVIQGPEWLKEELPFENTGLNTIIVDDLTPYRTKKVRILNGAHTAMMPVAYLYGLNTVEESVNHHVVGEFIKELIHTEILPVLDYSLTELEEYSVAVLERFKNPFIKHYLLSISLNSLSKFKTRNLPTLLEYVNRIGKPPKLFVFSLSSLFYFYRGKRGEDEIILDDKHEVLKLFKELWGKYEKNQIDLNEFAATILAEEQLWDMDLTIIPGLTQDIASNLQSIDSNGIKAALKEVTATFIQ
ncbi:tagaturonate reductase [Neobacillus cucumis]|uniref:tagaturonate reductase n=1 Tax=Neobacillus cucumis TaxID=1740721 RepID=UPI002E24C636|nr:tagaturonate reductase [Neobacillus cucumis]